MVFKYSAHYKGTCFNFYVTLFHCLYSRSHGLKAKSSEPMDVREF